MNYDVLLTLSSGDLTWPLYKYFILSGNDLKYIKKLYVKDVSAYIISSCWRILILKHFL